MAGIIKAGTRTAPHEGTAAVAFQFDDMSTAYLSKVRGEADAIIKKARDEAARIRTQAQEEGRQAALKAVEATLKARIDQQLASLIPALKQAVTQILDARQAWQRHWEQHALRVASAIASRIVRREIDKVPLITLDLVREALNLAAGNERITLRLHPDDQATLGDRVSQLAGELGSLAEVRVVADPAISSGGCRVDTEFGSIDQQLEAQLARITEELLD
ncbi:MAG TPA: FliH/SctL family protein [Pirellulaceae bacterium]|nr:FliH/SctL family protein [Pirellulaceae bacterium]